MIGTDELVDAFSDSLGEGKAEDVIADAAQRAGVPDRGQYSETEAIAIADEIGESDDVSSFVRISANTLKTRIRSGDVGS